MEFEKLKIKCECGGKMENIHTTIHNMPVRGWKCSKCQEELINPADAQRVLGLEKARKRNQLTVKLRKVGKSIVVTIPQPIISCEKLKEGQKMEWKIEKGKLVLVY